MRVVIIVLIIALLCIIAFIAWYLNGHEYTTVKCHTSRKKKTKKREGSSLKIAVVAGPLSNVSVPMREYSNHVFTMYTVNGPEDYDSVYSSLGHYDLIVGARNSAEVEAWMRSGINVPLITIDGTAILDLEGHPPLYRMVPDDSRTFQTIINRIKSLNASFTESELYENSALIVSANLRYSESLANIYATRGASAMGTSVEEFMNGHVSYIGVTDQSAEAAVNRFSDKPFIIYAALNHKNELLNRGSYEKEDDNSVGSVMVVPEQGYREKLPTIYNSSTTRFNVYGTSPAVETAPVIFADEYVKHEDWDNLLYRYTISTLEAVRKTTDIPRVFKMAEFYEDEMWQGYQPYYTRMIVSSYRIDLFGLEGVEDFRIIGYDDVLLGDISNTMYRVASLTMSGIHAQGSGAVRYKGVYGDSVTIPYSKLAHMSGTLDIPIYGELTSIQYADEAPVTRSVPLGIRF